MYGVLFAAMIEGEGIIITNEEDNDKGDLIPFMTTDEILKEIERFGFYVTYNVKSNLPSETVSYLATIDNFDFDKITRVSLQTLDKDGRGFHYAPTVLIYDSTKNPDLIGYGMKLSRNKYVDKVTENSIINVTNIGISWDWVDSMYNIADILDENLDPSDEYRSDEDIKKRNVEDDFHPYSEDTSGFTPYQGGDDDE